MSNEHICKICSKSLNRNGVPNHLKFVHSLIMKDYYDAFIKEKDEDICNHPNCSNITNFYGLRDGYNDHCSKTCNATNPVLAKTRGRKSQATKNANPEIVQKEIENHRKTLQANPEIMEDIHRKRLITLQNNPEITKNATKKRLETEKANPEIGVKRIEKTKQTKKANPEKERKWKDRLSISHRNYHKSIQKNYTEETHYLYIMKNLTKPIIKIGFSNEKSINRRKRTISKDFGKSEVVLLLKSTHKKIDDLETYLHDYFKEYCKVQPEKKSGRTEWFDIKILEEVIELASSKI